MKLADILSRFITAQDYEIDTLAKKIGVDKPQLALILEGELTPTAQVALKLSRVLNISPELIMDGNESVMAEVTTPQTRVSISQESNQEWLSPKKSMRSMDPVMISLSKDQKSELSSSEGEEFVFVSQGEVLLFVGDKQITLSSGDSTYYDSITPHYFKSLSELTQILVVKQSAI